MRVHVAQPVDRVGNLIQPVPQARQTLAASRSAYEVGRVDFLSLLDSQVRLLEAELQLERARADRRLAFASLEAAAGGKLR